MINNASTNKSDSKKNLQLLALGSAGAGAIVLAESQPANAQADPVADVTGIISGMDTIVTAGLALGVLSWTVVYGFRILRRVMR